MCVSTSQNPSQSQQSNHTNVFVEEKKGTCTLWLRPLIALHHALHFTDKCHIAMSKGEWSSFLIFISYTPVCCGTDLVRFLFPSSLSLGLFLIGFCVLRVPFTLVLVGYLFV